LTFLPFYYQSDPFLCDCWHFEVPCSLVFPLFMCFYIAIFSSVVNYSVGCFSHIKSFPWIILYVLAGLVSSRVNVPIFTTGVGV
jgi:hypothetical protein